MQCHADNISDSRRAFQRTGKPTDPIVEALRADESSDSFAVVWAATQADVRRFCRRYFRDPRDVEDVVAEVYLRAWCQADCYDSVRGSVAAWLLTMARSRCLDILRRRSRRSQWHDELAPGADFTDPQPTPEAVSLSESLRRRLVDALSHLDGEQRVAIEAAFFGEMSYSQVAQRLSLPLGTLKSRIRVGLQRLRQELGDLDVQIFAS